MHSVKSLAKDGTFKRVDAYTVSYSTIQVEPGFNLREEGPELEAHIDALFQFIMDGGEVPPLEVRVDGATGSVILVDGHCRHRAMGKAREAGAPIDQVRVIPFRGNDLDRVARIITSQEWRKLTPLELARGYKRMQGFGLSAAEIARRFHKSRQHVEQMLLLAGANNDVHQLVAGGTVSAGVAVEAVREHGEAAGDYLRGELEKTGAKRVTRGTISGPRVPPRLVTGLVTTASWVLKGLPSETTELLAQVKERQQREGVLSKTDTVPVPAELLLGLEVVVAEVTAALNKARAKGGEDATANE